MASLRSRIEKSPLLAKVIAAPIGWYIRLCHATTKWETAGLDHLQADLAKGSVVIMCWHGRLMMIGPHWPKADGNMSCLHDTAPIGRAAGFVQKSFGLDPFEMSARRSNIGTSRAVMKRAKDGISIGITADGPIGPGFQLQDPPLEWVRMMQRPVYGYAFATKRHFLLKTWDRMMLPIPFTKGACIFAPLDVNLPRKPTAEQLEVARIQLQVGLDAITAEANTVAGLGHLSDTNDS